MSDVTSPNWLRKLLGPDLRSVSESDRKIATMRIEQARKAGSLNEEQARERQEQVPLAQTRLELRPAIEGLPGTTSPGLLATRQVVTAVWFALTLVQFVIWVLVCIIGLHFANPWWIWSFVGGLIIVGPLWWFADAEFRTSNAAVNGEGVSTT